MDHQNSGDDTLEAEISAFLNPHSQPVARIQKKCCQMCFEFFEARSCHYRFCSNCKAKNDTYKFAEWLPTGTIN